jgi:hypothetical protein
MPKNVVNTPRTYENSPMWKVYQAETKNVTKRAINDPFSFMTSSEEDFRLKVLI